MFKKQKTKLTCTGKLEWYWICFSIDWWWAYCLTIWSLHILQFPSFFSGIRYFKNSYLKNECICPINIYTWLRWTGTLRKCINCEGLWEELRLMAVLHSYVIMRTLQGELCANKMMVLASLSLNFCFPLHKHSSIMAHSLDCHACMHRGATIPSSPSKSFLVM